MELLAADPLGAPIAIEARVDPSTGSLAVEIPIPLSPGRDGHGPQLSLSHAGYDPLSPFAHGWSLAGLPAIDIDAHDGLPRYDGSDPLPLRRSAARSDR